jgi:hypothetical protein
MTQFSRPGVFQTPEAAEEIYEARKEQTLSSGASWTERQPWFIERHGTRLPATKVLTVKRNRHTGIDEVIDVQVVDTNGHPVS